MGLWAWLFGLAACAVVVALRFAVSTDITRFAIDPSHARDARWIGVLAASEPARTMLVTVEHADREVAFAAAEALRLRVAEHDEVAWVRTGPDPAFGEQVHALYFGRRFRFVSPDPDVDIGPRFSDAGLDAAVARLKLELSRPSGVAIKHLAKDDPWLLFLDRTAAIAGPDDGTITVEDGHFVTATGHALVLLATKHGPMLGPVQVPFDRAIEAAIDEVEQTYGVVVERSALHRIAVASEAAVRADVESLTVASSLAVLAALLLAFRSVRQLVAIAVPLAAGVLVAMAATLVLFREIHGLTLAFGTTLIGVCVDYPVHLLAHHGIAAPGTSSTTTLQRVWPGLVLGALTTVAGFLALAGSPLPGLREIGTFAAIGVSTAVLATRTLVVPMVPAAGEPRGLPIAIARGLERMLAAAARNRGLVGVVLAAVVAFAGLGIARVEWIDDARALQRLQPALMDEDARVRERVGSVDVGRVLVVTGPTLEAALQVQDAAHARLRAAGLEGTTRSSQPLLWSAALQDDNLARVRAVPDLAGRTREALARAGFRPEAFGELDRGWREDPGPLALADFDDTALAPLVRPFVVEGEDVALLSFLRGSADASAIETAIDGVDGAALFDQRRYFADTYRGHREGTLVALALGLCAVAGVLGLRYRSLRVVVAALGPAVVATMLTLGVLAWLGTALHLLHLVASLLVLAMGVDYGVFAAESGDDPRARAGALTGVAIACITTVVSFAILATADNPALRALGSTVAIGVGASALLTPLTLVLLAGPRRTETST